MPSSPPPTPLPRARLRRGAWVLYDLANTVYAATLTFLFTPFAKTALGNDLRLIGITSLASMLVAGLLAPVFGVLIDQTTRTSRYLVIATLLCIAALAGFAVDGGPAWLLACFFVANVTYNLGLLFYNALLTAVAEPGREGRLSGLGTGIGYFGTILVLVLLLDLAVPTTTKFVVAALLFLVAALPCLVLVRDQRPPRATAAGQAWRQAFRQLHTTLRELPQHRSLLWFLLGNFCLVDVLNTAILYFADFTVTVFQPATTAGTALLFGQSCSSDGLLKLIGLLLNGMALVFGIVQGRWTDRAPLAVLRASAVALLLALVGGTLFGGNSVLGYALTLGVCGAFGLSGVWTAGRKMVVLLAPKERIG